MKKIVEVNENMSAMEDLLGENVTIFCFNYIYTGKLIGVNDSYVLLAKPKIVYETGAFNQVNWKDAQALPHDWYVMKSAIESWGLLDKKDDL